MNQAMFFINLLLGILAFFLCAMALIVFSSGKNKISNKFFVFFIISALFWVLANLMANISIKWGEPELLFWTKFTLIGPILMPSALILFAHSFPENKITFNKLNIVTLAFITILLLVLAPTNLFIKSVHIGDLSRYENSYTAGFLFNLYILFLLISIIIGCLILARKYPDATPIGKKQIGTVLIGIISSIATGTLLSAILPVLGFSQLINIGPVSVILFISFTSYAIIKHHLLDIRVILTEVASVIVLIALLIQVVQSIESGNLTNMIVSIVIFCVVAYGGYLLIKSVQDEISRRRQIQELASRLDAANKHLEELDKLKDNFMSMASHELNTPIAAILGYLSMILEEGMGGEISSKARQYLMSVYESSKRLAALVKDLLNVSRIESGRIHLIYEEVQMENLIDQAIMEVGSKVKEANHDLTFEKPKILTPKTWLDKTRITEVIINFLGNAIKYTPPGGKIDIRVLQKGDDIEVSVQDNGKGIPKDKQDKVFQKFTQVDVLKDEVKGTGLGMYISKNLIELHKGKIWFESDGSGKGTTFFFTVPVLRQKPHDEHEGEGAVL